MKDKKDIYKICTIALYADQKPTETRISNTQMSTLDSDCGIIVYHFV